MSRIKKESCLLIQEGVVCLAGQVNVKADLPNGQGSRQVSHQQSQTLRSKFEFSFVAAIHFLQK